MLVEHKYLRRYLFAGLKAGPVVVERLLAGMSAEEADWRPDPQRFTLREAIAHLADWEPIFLGRMQRICAEDSPVLEDMDEGVLAIEHNYAALDPFEQLARFRDGRAKLIAFLEERADSDWARVGNRPEIGDITLETIATLVPLHDNYHTAQIVQWRDAFAS
jgi:hypothetical protein